MLNRIAIMGLNGSGKSTLAHALAKKIGYFEIDVEDYYFPEQKASRQAALEGRYDISCNHLGNIPYSVARSKFEVEELLSLDIDNSPQFIISAVTMNWSENISKRIDIAFILEASNEERIRRVQHREEKRFGNRVKMGGDMYEQQQAFREIIANKDINTVTDSAERLGCKVIHLNGSKPVEENIKVILENIC